MEVFRITHNKWSQNLSGSGYAARWNSQGVYIVYTADSRALACLENIVHRGSTNLSMPFLIKKILIHAEESILELPPELLPDEWNKNGEEGYILCRPFGNTWIKNSDSAVLKTLSEN